MFLSVSDTVAAVNETWIESTGPDGYGWQQVYINTTDGGVPMYNRLTGSADRQYYDYGYKQIQISGRIEDYWSRDCGWWYVSGTPTIQYINITNRTNDLINYSSSIGTTRGLGRVTYDWSDINQSGRLNVSVINGSLIASFFIYVRGQLNVTDIYTSGNTAESDVVVNATIKDQSNKIINDTYNNTYNERINVTMYVSGAGFNNVSNMTGVGNNWTASFTPPRPGDYYITIKASDGHQYWIDGRGSEKVSITGTFPSAFVSSGASIIKIILMILLALLLLRRPGTVAMKRLMSFI